MISEAIEFLEDDEGDEDLQTQCTNDVQSTENEHNLTSNRKIRSKSFGEYTGSQV